eukprot:tig00001067_g6781.t1
MSGERRPTVGSGIVFRMSLEPPGGPSGPSSPRSVAESKVARSVMSLALLKPQSKLLAPSSKVRMHGNQRHLPPNMKKSKDEEPNIKQCKFGMVTYVTPEGMKCRIRVVVSDQGEIGWNLKDIQGVVGAATHILRKKTSDLRPLMSVQYDPLNIFEGVTKDGMFLLGLHIPKHARSLQEWSNSRHAYPVTTCAGPPARPPCAPRPAARG